MGNPDLDLKIRILHLQLLLFGFSFLPFDWEICKRIRKIVLKNSGLACARIISKKKTAVHENSFANPFFGFPSRTVKRKSMKSGFGFLLKSTLRTDFSEVKSVFGFRIRLQNPKSGFQNLNLDFPIERNPRLILNFLCLLVLLIHELG